MSNDFFEGVHLAAQRLPHSLSCGWVYLGDHTTGLGESSHQFGQIFGAGERESRGLQHSVVLSISYDSILLPKRINVKQLSWGADPAAPEKLPGAR
ncbi:MAG: hypothetical protein [Caudoviricetes sp.]|nr:MAG: hypothetical protein [Caudoviricetes sp.]